jgi:hypothetical protein
MAIEFILYKTISIFIFRWTNGHRSTQRVGAKKIERRTKIQESSKRDYPLVHSLSPSISTITPNQEIAKKTQVQHLIGLLITVRLWLQRTCPKVKKTRIQ